MPPERVMFVQDPGYTLIEIDSGEVRSMIRMTFYCKIEERGGPGCAAQCEECEFLEGEMP